MVTPPTETLGSAKYYVEFENETEEVFVKGICALNIKASIFTVP